MSKLICKIFGHKFTRKETKHSRGITSIICICERCGDTFEIQSK